MAKKTAQTETMSCKIIAEWDEDFGDASEARSSQKSKSKKSKWTPERIKHLRKEGYKQTQEEFCKRLAVSLSTLKWWEQGHGEPIGPAQILLDRLAEDLGQAEPSA